MGDLTAGEIGGRMGRSGRLRPLGTLKNPIRAPLLMKQAMGSPI